MSFKDIGKFTNIIKDFEGLSDVTDIDKILALADILDDFTNITDVSKALKVSNVTKEVAESALENSHCAESLGNIAEGATEGAATVTNLEKATKGLSSNAESVSSLALVFKGLGEVIKKNAFLLSGLGAILLTGFIANKINKDYFDYDTGMEKAQSSYQSFQEESTKYDQINSQLDEKKQRIQEINDLISSGRGTLALQGELTALQQQTKELESQKNIQKQVKSKKQKEAADNALDALSRKKNSLVTKKSSGGVQDYEHAARVNVLQSAKEKMLSLKKLKKEKETLQNELDSGVDSKTDKPLTKTDKSDKKSDWRQSKSNMIS